MYRIYRQPSFPQCPCLSIFLSLSLSPLFLIFTCCCIVYRDFPSLLPLSVCLFPPPSNLHVLEMATSRQFSHFILSFIHATLKWSWIKDFFFKLVLFISKLYLKFNIWKFSKTYRDRISKYRRSWFSKISRYIDISVNRCTPISR